MPVQLDQSRLAEVFRLKVAGYSDDEIARELSTRAIGRFGTDSLQVQRDIAAINRIMEEYGDQEKARTSIALELDRLFSMILDDLNYQYNWSSRPGARAELYKQGLQALFQKSQLYGLNSDNLTISQNSKLMVLVRQLRQLDETELEPEASRLPGSEFIALPTPDSAADGLLVESDSGDGRRARG